jgi:hypothetical protein
MTNHPNRPKRMDGPFADLDEQSATLRDMRDRAGLTQFQAGFHARAPLKTWIKWESGERAMPGAAMELFCLAMVVGDVDHGPWLPAGDWLQRWVRHEFWLFFQRPITRPAA